MILPTYGQIELKVRKDLDLLDDQNFIVQDEMAGYYNDAVDEAESEILNIGEDYFLDYAPVTLVDGTAEYALPANIYAQKIRTLLYINGTIRYEVPRLREPHKFQQKSDIDYYGSGPNEYAYMLINATEEEQAKIMLSPPAKESGSVMQLWYLRNAKRVGLQSDGTSRADQLATILDIPEFRAFIEQRMKCSCYEKDKDVRLVKAEEKLEKLRAMMINTLTKRTPDGQNQVPFDVSIYEEHS